MTCVTLFSPAGVLAPGAPVQRAVQRLTERGFAVTVDPSARARRQRFAGDDDTRLQAIHRVAADAPSVALATRGGYGLTRLLPRLDWALLARSVDAGTRWVGYSDMTALQLGLWATQKRTSWAGPLAVDDFGRDEPDEVTGEVFTEAMSGQLEAIGFRTEPGHDGLAVRGRLWGGNLTVLMSLLGTPYWPRFKGGVLFVEDVNEHPYRIERMLLQLHQAGVLADQKAVLVGAVSGWKPSPLDRGYTMKSALAAVRSVCGTPLLTGLPFGHVPTKVCLPVGRRVEVLVQGRDVLVGWGHGDD